MFHHYFHHFLNDLAAEVQRLGAWSYVILALAVMVEGPIATLLGAGAASAGLMRPWLVFVAAACGNLAGDILWYSLGRLGKAEWLEKNGRRLGVPLNGIKEMERKIRRNAPKIIFVAKLTLVFTIPALVAAGVVRVPKRRWFPIDAVAECIWTGTLVTAGYYLSQYIQRLEKGVQIITILGGILFFVFVFAFVRHYGRQWGSRASDDGSEESVEKQDVGAVSA